MSSINPDSTVAKWSDAVPVRHNSELVTVERGLELYSPLRIKAQELVAELNGTEANNRADQSTPEGRREKAAAIAKDVLKLGEHFEAGNNAGWVRTSPISDAQKNLVEAVQLLESETSTTGQVLAKPVEIEV